MAKYSPIPYVMVNGAYTVSDDYLRGVWEHMVATGKDRTVFYDGFPASADQFLLFMKRADNIPVLMIDEESKTLSVLAWLNEVHDACARGHWCVFGRYHRGSLDSVLAYWSSWRDEAGHPVLRTVIGITPETYETALKAVRLAGMTIIGVIPHICSMVYEGQSIGGVVSYFCPTKEVDDGR